MSRPALHSGVTSDWDISLTLQARFWSLHTNAFLAKWHAGESAVCSMCRLTSDTVPHRLGGCTHPAINSRVKLRHGCTVGLIAHLVGVGKGLETASCCMMLRAMMAGTAAFLNGS